METVDYILWRAARVAFVLLFFMTPYIAVAADRAAFFERGYITNGGELFVPLLCFAALYTLSKVERHLHKSLKEYLHENKSKRQAVL